MWLAVVVVLYGVMALERLGAGDVSFAVVLGIWAASAAAITAWRRRSGMRLDAAERANFALLAASGRPYEPAGEGERHPRALDARSGRGAGTKSAARAASGRPPG